MHVLTVPNWSFGRERGLLREVVDLLDAAPVRVHFAEADIDHNRTVTAFSGEPSAVRETLLALGDLILPGLDLQRHRGVHPRIGGLDVCPFIPLPAPEGSAEAEFGAWVDQTAEMVAERFQVPVYLYERSARPGHVRELPTLRKGGFGSLLDRDLSPDFGPNRAHPHLGATVMGWRSFLIALNVNFKGDNLDAVERIAHKMRQMRKNGDPRLRGVRVLGLPLPAQGMVQVSMNFTRPDDVMIDPVIDFITQHGSLYGLKEHFTQLIGVIRDVDLERSVLVNYRPEQMIATRQYQSEASDV